MGRGGGDPLAPRLIRSAGLIREILSAREIVRRNVAEAGEALERSSKLLAYQERIWSGPDPLRRSIVKRRAMVSKSTRSGDTVAQ